MCGIAGIVEFSAHDVDKRRSRVESMTQAIAHRGPDADGFYHDSAASLGHRRLAIIDLESGAQPMSTADQRFHIVFNGELYNFPELRERLETKGHSFRTHCDTEVVLESYACWGAECLEYFNGMFALAIWDARDRKLFLARDRLGKKPLYVLRQDGRIVFGSELKSLLKSGFVDAALDPASVVDYFSFGYIPSPRTIFRSVRKLASATFSLESPNSYEEKRYWKPEFKEPIVRPMDQVLDELSDLVDDAVRCRMISDVPLGAFLSGGIDSSLVVSTMARLSSEPVKTHTIGVDDPDFNEADVAKKIAGHLGTDHREYVVSPHAKELLNQIAGFLDEPFADPSVLPSWLVCQMTRQSVTVAMSGDGGDEAFGGYTFRYLPHRVESYWRRVLPAALRVPVFGALHSIWPRRAGLPAPLRLASIFRNLMVSDAEAFYLDLLMLDEGDLESAFDTSWTEKPMGYNGFETVQSLYVDNNASDSVGRAQYADMMFYMTEDVLAKVDRMSMAHSLEVRSPLLDYRVIEFANSLPTTQKLGWKRGKLPLRALAARAIPAEILDQPKRGFSIPFSSWLRGELREMAAEMIFDQSGAMPAILDTGRLESIWKSHQTGERDYGNFIWSLMMFRFWETNFLHDAVQVES